MVSTYLTTIPLGYAQEGARWSESRPAQEAHRDVMSLFGQVQGGRSEHGILFRLDPVAHIMGRDGLKHEGRALLVRSRVHLDPKPDALTSTMRERMVTTAEATAPAEGAPLIIQLDLNTAKRTKDGDRPVPMDQIHQWITSRLVAALDVKGFTRMRTRTIDGPSGGRLRITGVSGVATVKDTTELERLRREGVGRAKNYGCGLLTWTQL